MNYSWFPQWRAKNKRERERRKGRERERGGKNEITILPTVLLNYCVLHLDITAAIVEVMPGA